MASALRISLLGGLRVFVDEAEISLPPSRKVRALLGFLAATGRPHRRERLCELFWNTPDDPKAGLRWALSKIRRLVDSDTTPRINADRERIRLDVSEIDIDVVGIFAALKTEGTALKQLTAMADALNDPFLAGLDGAGGPAFALWLQAERGDLHRARIRLLDRVIAHRDLPAAEREKWQNLARNLTPSQQSTAPVEEPRPTPSGQWGQSRAGALRTQRIGFCTAADGTKIAHATVGKGAPLLKAANWLNHLEFDWASPIWGKSFESIARHRTFIRYDERGCGLSDWDVKDLSFEAFVDDLDAVVSALGLKRFPLLGISQGCAVSIEYAVRFPERVSALILIGGYAAGWRYLASPKEQETREAVIKLTELGWGTDNPAYRHIFSQTFMPDAPARDLNWFDEFQRLTTSPANAARFQSAFGEIDVRDQLSKVRVPTLVLHARNDQRIPMDQGRAIASAIPGAQFVSLDSRNHILVDSEPAWRVANRAITRFLIEANA